MVLKGKAPTLLHGSARHPMLKCLSCPVCFIGITSAKQCAFSSQLSLVYLANCNLQLRSTEKKSFSRERSMGALFYKLLFINTQAITHHTFLVVFPKRVLWTFPTNLNKPGSLSPWPPSSASRDWIALPRACRTHYDRAGTR